jgi:DNA-binding IclR family transcriptional regulator
MAVDSGSVKSAERVLALLELLGERKTPLRLIDIVEALKIPKSSAHGLLQTLIAKDFVVRDELQRYRVGMKLFSLAATALEFQDIRHIARPTMETLAKQLHATCNLAVLDGHDVLYVEKVEDPSNPVRVVTQVGTRLPAHVTSLGKVLVAELPEDIAKTWLREHTFTKFTAQSRTSATAFGRDLRAYRQLGFAMDQHEFHDVISGFASGVRDSSGTVVAALSLTCLGSTAEAGEQARIGQAVREAADEISLHLGDAVVGPDSA